MAFVTATNTYRFNNVGTRTDAELNAAVTAVPLIVDTLLAVGMSVTTDTTTTVGPGEVDRVLVVSLIQPLIANANNPPPSVPFTGWIVSSSDDDTNAAGVGLRQVTIAYLDPTSGAHSEVGVSMTGRTPVRLATNDKATITGVTFTSVGAFGTSKGVVTLSADAYQAPAKGPPSDYTTEQPAPIVVTMPAGYYNNDADAAQAAGFLEGIFTGQFRTALGFPANDVSTVLA